MTTSTTSLPASKTVLSHSCERCAIRKVRCDRQYPCAACVRHNVECQYRVLAPPRRKKKKDRTEILDVRMKQYERAIQQKDPLSLGSEEAAASQSSQSTSPQPASAVIRNQLLHDQGRSKFLDNGLWTRVVEELGSPEEALEDSSDDDAPQEEIAPDSVDFVLGLTPTSMSTESFHPPPEQINELWQIFLENVDPLTKVVHCPTLQPVVQKAIINPSLLSKSLEALLFAIYTISVVSLKDADCRRRLGEPRNVLVSRYSVATKIGLQRARFISTSSLAVLQAFLIHLLSMRDVYDARTLWTLVGLALRIAGAMGLHRDGSSLGLSPYETEIRRRVWWQLRVLEGRSAELSGSDKFGSFDTDPRTPKLPANINDDELHPNMSAPPMESDRVTDMVFCVLRFELRRFWTVTTAKQRQAGKDDPLFDSYGSGIGMEEKEKAISEIEAVLETKFIRYCDPSIPIQLMATSIARASVNTMRLVAHHPRRWGNQQQVPESERQLVWNLSMKLLRQFSMVISHRGLARFAWQATFYFQWQPYIHILDTLRANPFQQQATEAWDIIHEIYETYPEFVTNTKKALYIAVGSLCVKAYTAREAALAKMSQPLPPTPEYIKTFRWQRETANARRKRQAGTIERVQRSSMVPSTINEPPSHAREALPDFQHSLHDQPLNMLQLSQSLPAEPESALQTQSIPDSNAPWHTGSFNEQADCVFDYSNETNFMDFETLLSQDAEMYDTANQTIDWERWDALLAIPM